MAIFNGYATFHQQVSLQCCVACTLCVTCMMYSFKLVHYL
uniref:Uncharacterized protein n=1 Tax=Arundo donax TaxID=35708 RepID=A0A0A9F7I8_ARUDO